MDDQRFDRMSKTLAGGISRRRLLTLLGAGVAGAAAGLVGRPRGSLALECPICHNQVGDSCVPYPVVNGWTTTCQFPLDGGCIGGVCLDGVCTPDQPLRFGLPCAHGVCDGQGACHHGCLIGSLVGGQLVNSGELKPGSICGVCDPTKDKFRWSPANPGLVCRPAEGVCDIAEVCDGSSPDCPPDHVYGGFYDGDFAEWKFCNNEDQPCTTPTATLCNGDDKFCPPDDFKPDGTPCDDGDGNACNGVGTCQSGACVPGAPVVCASPRACEADGGVCDPGTGACAYAPKAAGTVCREAAGPCDIAEVCDGSSPDCPPDAFALAGARCDDDDHCNGAETCDGNGQCVPGTAVTCPAPADACHIAGSCDPASGLCSDPAPNVGSCGTGRVKDGPCLCDGTCCLPEQICAGRPGERLCLAPDKG